ncbi:MAG: VOC family protein [Elainellaceae cyanobacterium]
MSISNPNFLPCPLENQTTACLDDFLLEPDHFIIYTDNRTSAVERLQELGFFVNQSVHYIECGTVSSIVFFENIYLEIVGIDETVAIAQSGLLGLDQIERIHWRKTLVSPFGLGLRCKQNSVGSLHANETLEWMSFSNSSIYFETNNFSKTDEPFCFLVPAALALTTWLNPSLQHHRNLFSHLLNVQRVTDVKITVHAYSKLSNVVTTLLQNRVLSINRGLFPLLELTFDGGITGKTVDIRPLLPLILKY